MNNETTIAEQLLSGNTVISYTKGKSMRPLLVEGKTCVVLQPITEELKVGDIALFMRSEYTYVLHRIVGIDGDSYITRGDNCLGSERTHKDRFLGVVTAIKSKDNEIHITDKGYLRYVRRLEKSWWIRRRLYRLRGYYGRIRARIGSSVLGRAIKKIIRK